MKSIVMRKQLNRHLFTLFASAAFSGFSLSHVYAVPNYIPDSASPVGSVANSQDGGVGLSYGLGLINDQLVSATLAIPASGVGLPSATKDQFNEAFVLAFQSAGSIEDKVAIMSAAVHYAPVVKSTTLLLVQKAMNVYLVDGDYSEEGALSILSGALGTESGSSADVIKGLILAVGEFGDEFQEAATGSLAAGLYVESFERTGYDDAVNAGKLVGAFAEAAVKSVVKPGAKGYSPESFSGAVNSVAYELVRAVLESNSDLVLSDVSTGVMKGYKALLATKLVGYSDGFQSISSALADASLGQRASAVLGASKVFAASDTVNFELLKAAFDSVPETNAVADGFKATLGNTGGAASRVAGFTTYASANPLLAPYYALGAVGASAALSPAIVTAGMGSLSNTETKSLLLEVLSREVPEQAAKSSAAAVSAVGGLSAEQALNASLPNAISLYSGSIVKEVAKVSPATSTSLLASTVINALTSAPAVGPEDDFKSGVIDGISEIMKLRKGSGDFTSIINSGIAAGYGTSMVCEAVAVAIGRGDAKVDHSAVLTEALISQGASSDEIQSVLLAERVSRISVVSKAPIKTTLAEIRNAPISSLAAAVLAGGAVDEASTPIFLAAALRQGWGSASYEQNLDILKSAKSVSKKLEDDIQIAYETAEKVLADSDQLFEIVSNQTIKFPKRGVVVAAAAAAAAPGYANFVARAAGFRATTATVGKLPAAIFDAADMDANLNSNPSAAAAISAGFVSGIIDQKQSAVNQEKLLAAVVFALVKEASSYGFKGTPKVGTTPASGGFRTVDILTGAAPTSSTGAEYGTAAAVTGATSVLSNTGDNGLFALNNSSPLYVMLRAAGKAVGKAVGSQMTVIAQAAAQAAVWVSGVGAIYDVSNIAIAISQGAFNTTSLIPDSRILEAANSGKAEALLGFKGAGAAGVVDYAHFNTNNSPVTDISNF